MRSTFCIPVLQLEVFTLSKTWEATSQPLFQLIKCEFGSDMEIAGLITICHFQQHHCYWKFVEALSTDNDHLFSLFDSFFLS